jgi:V8-like Glu-specific endopeptidase
MRSVIAVRLAAAATLAIAAPLVAGAAATAPSAPPAAAATAPSAPPAAAASSSWPHRMRHAHVTGGSPTVGALFASASSRTHFCTASVVHSPRGNVLITAAHCLHGTVRGWSFAPGFHDGVAPDGRWSVTGAYLDPDWLTAQDPRRDYAFLTVAPRNIQGRWTNVESVTGGNLLGSIPHRGERISVPGVPRGTDDAPLTCTTTVYFRGIFPAFDCDPYVDGTSGSPWLAAAPDGGQEVVGVIGGLHQGGCHSWTSYSSRLGAHARAAYRRAVAESTPDIAPRPGADGCATGL